MADIVDNITGDHINTETMNIIPVGLKNLIKSIKEETKSTRSKISDTYLELVELFPLGTIESEKDHKIALSVVEKIEEGIEKGDAN